VKIVYSLLLVIAFSGSATAQFLNEDFSNGVPPMGWTVSNNNSSFTVGWISDGTGRAWHEDENSSLGTADNTMISPAMDFSSASGITLAFAGETNWVVYLANHPNSFGDGVSTMEITTDGGLSWTVVWTDTSLNNGDTYNPTVDLSAWDGQANVQLGIHYFGTFAQEWWLDYVEITGTQAPVYSVTGIIAGGTAILRIVGASPGGNVLIAYSTTGAGPTATAYGFVDMSSPIVQLPMLVADGTGLATTTASLPSSAQGKTLFTQAVDLSSGVLTNSLTEVVL
jgi:hypothetical protein